MYTDALNEQMKQFSDLQAKSLEPMRAFGNIAVEAFEQMSKQSQALAGDVVDFQIKQSNIALKSDDMSATANAQMAESKAFAELMSRRSEEYVELVSELGGKVRQAGTDAVAEFKAA